MPYRLMKHRLPKRLVAAVLGFGIASASPAGAQQMLTREPDVKLLACGQKVIVNNNTCPAGEVLQITGSCLDAKATTEPNPRGTQYNCIKKK